MQHSTPGVTSQYFNTLRDTPGVRHLAILLARWQGKGYHWIVTERESTGELHAAGFFQLFSGTIQQIFNGNSAQDQGAPPWLVHYPDSDHIFSSATLHY